MKKIIIQILLVSIFTIASLYGIISIAVEETGLLGGAEIAVNTTKAYSFVTTTITDINKFPADGDVFNSDEHFFCAQHHVSYAGDKDNNLGDGYHVNNTVTKNKWAYSKGVLSTYATSPTADIDTTADYYVDSNGVFHAPATEKTYIGYKNSTETPSDSVATNWVFIPHDMTFNCETNSNDAGFAFLLARYIGGEGNNSHTRGDYHDDPLQSAVWDYFGQLNKPGYEGESNFLETQATAYATYHADSANPNVDVTPASNVGTTKSGSTYIVGPFTMSNYVRAKDYSCPRATSLLTTTDATLQDIFGSAADLQGTVIKAEAIVKNGTGGTKAIEFPVPEPNATFSINLNETDINGYDELYEIRFTYQRVHACANGKKYEGIQYQINFVQKGESRDGSSSGTDRGCSSGYNCTSCYNDGHSWANRSDAKCHALWCGGSGYCSDGNSQGTVYSGLWSSCSYSWACGDNEHTHTGKSGSCYSYCNTTEHSHGTGCNTAKCKHECKTYCNTYGCYHSHTSACCSKTVHSHSDSCRYLSCTDNEHTHSLASCGKTHTCSKNYCSHGHASGHHGGHGSCGGKTWGASHSDCCEGTTICSHEHTSCHQFTWTYSSKYEVAQDTFTGAGTLTNEIKTYTINVAVPLKTNMKIYKYISNVEHRQTGGTNDLTVDDRSGKTVAEKSADTVKVERGDIVTYTIKIVNASRFPTAVKVKDILPAPFKNLEIDGRFEYTGQSGAVNTATWVEVPANDTVTITVKLDPDAITGTFENKVEFITKNDTTEKMKYTIWGSDSTHGAHTYGNIVNIDTTREQDSDYYTIKEYDVTLDKYITEVKHETNGVVTYSGTERKNKDTESEKKNNPLYAEYGDVVTYKIDVYNTMSPYLNAGSNNRDEAPFWKPDIAYVDIEDDLPGKYSKLSVTTSNGSGTLTTSTGKFTLKNVKVAAGGKTTVTVTLIVEEHAKGTLEENNAKIKGQARNVNQKDILNHSAKTSTSDWYKINDYNLTLDKFISSYNASMTEFNNDNKFTTESNVLADRYTMTESQKQTAPLQVEKTETLVYTIRLTNNSTGSGLKKATQVRPTKVQDAMDEGLTFQSVKAIIKKADGSNKYSYNIAVTWKNIGNNTYTFEIDNKRGNDYLILDPGEYIDYEVTVKVTKTNMYLYSLKNTGSMAILTNINNDTESREVKNDSYNENIAGEQVSSEYVKLKDLTIAGKVWLDRDKDGYIGKNANGNLEVGGNAINVETNPSTNITDTTGKEYAMQGIVVKLYTSDGNLVRTTKTDTNGLFTFARKEDGATYYANQYSASGSGVVESEQRIPKATNKDANKNYTTNSKLISYYIEYEYDGLVYKSTDIYSDNSNLDNEGGIKADNKYKIDSNAYEFADVRENFNKDYEIISFNKASKGDLSAEQALEYDKQNHNSYIRENNSRIITARSFITKGSNASIDNTKCLWLYQQTTKDDKPETEYLKYINLGLEEREDVDISITQDVYEVKTTINGEEMTYEYNQNNNTLGNSKLDKEQEKDSSGNETAYSKSFNSGHFITGYKDDTSSVENNRVLYNFEYYLEDYNYRVSQYHTETVRAYKGSSDRNFNADAVTDANSTLLANSVGRESELNTEVTFRIKVTNNSITEDEPFKSDKDIKVYTGINEIVEYYDKDFVNLTFNGDGSLRGFNIKTKDENGYLVNKEIKAVSAVAVMKDGSEKAVSLSNSSKYNTTRTLANYDTLYITPAVENTHSNTLTDKGIKAGDFILGEGESLDILITFVVEKEIENPDTKEIETILGAKENVAEISAYSTYYKDGNNYKSASLIDKDSNPGNFGEAYGGVSNVDSKEYIKYFEDDTFKTGITFRVPSPTPDDPDEEERYKNNIQRTLTGFVWDDARTNEAKDDYGTQYIGDGTYDTSKTAIEEAKKNSSVSNKEETDTKVKDVKTQLVEIIRMPDPEDPSIERIYEDTIYVNGEDSIMETRTSSDGTYKLSGYIPGEYIVRFVYGDDVSKDNMLIFNGQDYKSTSYQTGEAVYAENATANGDKAASDMTLEILEHSGNSDAKDDEIRRLEVIGYSETMTNERNKVLRGINSTDKTALISNTSMEAETPDFLVRTEKEIKKVTVLKFSEHNKKITETITDARFAINNIDFGLQYRPELQVALNNYLSNITVTTSDESGASETPLIDAVFDPYYGIVKKTDTITGVTTFVTGADGEIVTVDPAAPNTIIENAITTAGGNISDAQKNNDGTYVLALAGTILNTEKSVGLTNVQYLPNEYYTEADGTPKVEEVDGKYLVKATQGFAYIVIDDNIMQGATIKVKYLLSGSNFSEIDRVSSNLSDIRFKENQETEKYAKVGGTLDQYYEEVAYQVSADNQKPTLVNQNYSAAMTARNALFSEYYRYELEGNTIKKDVNGQNDVVYAVKAKEMPVDGKVVKIADVTNPHKGSDGYYGRYLGSTYYTGAISAMDVVAELKLDKIIDYVDNDLVFNDSDNKGKNGLWKTTTSSELYDAKWIEKDSFAAIDTTGAIVENSATFAGDYKLVDSEGREYDTDVRSNLALSLDDRVRDDYGATETDPTINEDISKFLMPRYSKSLESYGTITLTASKVLSPEDKSDDMTYENIAEIIQYTSVTGRVTNLATTIGNAKIEEIGRNANESPEFYEGRTESDTASVEKITLTPPTGLSKVDQVVRNVVESASNVVFVVITVVLVCVVVAVIIHLYHRRRIK